MDDLTFKTVQLAIAVNKEDLMTGVWQVVSKLKSQWSEDKIQYKVILKKRVCKVGPKVDTNFSRYSVME